MMIEMVWFDDGVRSVTVIIFEPNTQTNGFALLLHRNKEKRKHSKRNF
jgi:hypothetical protein